MQKSVSETTVTIHGSSIELRTDLSEDELERLASFVDKKMRELDPRGTLPHSKVSLLTSLSLASELMQERERAEASRRDITRRLEHLHEMLDEALGGK